MRTIYIIGASQTQEYEHKTQGNFIQGWAHFITDKFTIPVENHAHAGWSLKKFIFSEEYIKGETNINDITKSEWYKILQKIKPDDFVMFYWTGINDMLQNVCDAYRPCEGGAYVRDEQNKLTESYIHIGDGLGTHTLFTYTSKLDEYVDLFVSMINDVKDRKATPIIIKGTGKYYSVKNNEKNVVSVVRHYARATEDVAKITSADYIDLAAEFEKLFTDIGYAEMLNRYFVPDDNVHYNIVGAKLVAQMVMKMIDGSDYKIKEYLK